MIMTNVLDVVSVEMPGDPVGKQRARVGRRGAYTPSKTRSWEEGAAFLIRQGLRGRTFCAPVGVRVLAVKKRPRRLARKCDPDGLMWAPVTPDVDNVVKIAMDALTLAGAYPDDACVVHVEGWTCYAEKDGAPRVVIEVAQLTGQPEAL